MKKSDIFSTILSLSVSSLAIAAMAVPAMAQTKPADNAQSGDKKAGEESAPKSEQSEQAAPEVLMPGVIVRGYRSSLDSSLNVKRLSDQIIDTITAVDINSFPDQNVIESLSRITGVQITRDANGEGDLFQIRGLPDVRIEIDGQKQVGGRYDGGVVGSALPSELFGQVQVVKTQAADDTEGGTGGIVRFNTRGTLDSKKDFTLSVSGEGNYSNNSREFGYKFSGTIAKNFRATPIGDIGLLFSYTRNRTLGQADRFRSNDGYIVDNSLQGDFNGNGVANEPTTSREFNGATVVDSLGDGVIRPAGALQAEFESINRKEISYNAAIQWKPIDTLNIYARTTRVSQSNRTNVVSFSTSTRPLSQWDPATLEIENQIAVAGTINGTGGFSNAAQAQGFDLHQNSVQAGLDWEVTPRLKASFKFQDGSGGTDNPLRIPIVGGVSGQTDTTQFDLRTGVPTVLPLDNAGQAFDTGQAVGAGFNPFVIGIFDADINESQSDRAYQLDFDYGVDLGWIDQIEFGVRYNVQHNTLRIVQFSQFDFDGQDPQLPFRFRNLAGLEADIPGIVTRFSRSNSFGGANNGNIPTSFTILDPTFFRTAAYNDTFRANNFTNQNGSPVGPTIDPNAQRDGTYDIIAGYVKFDLDGDVPYIDLPFRGNFGLRVVNTSQSVLGLVLDEVSGTPVSGFAKGENTVFLPSMSLNFDIRKDLIARFGVGRTLSRPGLEQLVPNESISLSLDTVTRGNGGLRPILVTGVDLSLEWYFNKNGLLSLAGFYKRQKNLAATFTSVQCLPDTESAAISTEAGTGNILRDVRAIDVCTAAGFGSEADLRSRDAFTVSSIENIGSNTIVGFEFGYQQNFTFLPSPFDGLGTLANYTYTTGENPLVSPLGNQLPLLGLSKHSFNSTIFYEKYGFSARLSYNYRTQYLENNLNNTQRNIGSSPSTRNTFGQLDAAISYAITSQVSITADATNLLKRPQISYADFRTALLEQTQTDRRFFFGVKTAF